MLQQLVSGESATGWGTSQRKSISKVSHFVTRRTTVTPLRWYHVISICSPSFEPRRNFFWRTYNHVECCDGETIAFALTQIRSSTELGMELHQEQGNLRQQKGRMILFGFCRFLGSRISKIWYHLPCPNQRDPLSLQRVPDWQGSKAGDHRRRRWENSAGWWSGRHPSCQCQGYQPIPNASELADVSGFKNINQSQLKDGILPRIVQAWLGLLINTHRIKGIPLPDNSAATMRQINFVM